MKKRSRIIYIIGVLLLISVLLFLGALRVKGVKEDYCLTKTHLRFPVDEPMEGEKWDHYTSCYNDISFSRLLGLLNGRTNDKLSQILDLERKLKDSKYAQKDTQARDELHNQWCSLIARPASEREKAVASIRGFSGKPTLDVEYECSFYNDADYEDLPTKETYTAGGDRYYIDPQTNYVYSMEPIAGRWGYTEEGVRWMDPIREYDYSQGMTPEEAEQYARDFISLHEDSIGKIDLDSLEMEVGSKGTGTSQVNYFVTWRGEPQTIQVLEGIMTCGDIREDLINSYDDNGTPCNTKYEKEYTPSVSLSFSSGGELIGFGDQLNPDLW